MTIAFDDGAADLLITAAGTAANELREQGTARRTDAETAAADFTGSYASLFATACATESTDRGQLAGVLDDLATQVGTAKLKAAEEKQRLADLDDWTTRESARALRQATSLSGASGTTQVLYDPKPSETPIQPPTISAAFSAQSRSRSIAAGASGKSSADPNDLNTFVTGAKSANGRMEDELTAVRDAWSGFTTACSWVNCGTTTFVLGFENLLVENQADVDWIERVSAAFQLAGSGGTFSPSSPLSDAAIGLATGAMQRYRGRLVIPAGNAAIPLELTNPGAIDTDWKKEFIGGKWHSINPTNGFRAPVGSWGYHPLSPAAANPSGWRNRFVFTADPKFGAPPAWASWGSKGLGVAGAGLTYWGSYSDSYNTNLTRHPDWDEGQRQDRAFQDSAIVGTSTVAGSLLGAAAAGAAIGSIVPGPGTAVGLVVGLGAGLVGGLIGGWLGNELGKGAADELHGENRTVLAPGPQGYSPTGQGDFA